MLTQTNANLSPNVVAYPSSSPLTNATVFSFTGSIAFRIIGRVITAIQAQATTVKMSVKSDALAASDICATLDINGFAVGSLLTIDGTVADAMKGTSGVSDAPQGAALVATCVTSGIITTTFGANSTGAIQWEIQWQPLNAKGNVIPA
jgi:hypothetical protein